MIRTAAAFPGALLVAVSTTAALATEPNNTFFDATILVPGVTSVSDDLLDSGGGSNPDTLLGSIGSTGLIESIDDDSSPLGDGLASALFGVPTNLEAVQFSVTGCCDNFFTGAHSVSGGYEVFVTVFDLFGVQVDDFSVTGSLAPGAVDDYTFVDSDYFFGSYNVVIDNTVGGGAGSDVDFFTFTGLPPGTAFAAETGDPFLDGIDTVLGLFDDSGNLIDSNDDTPLNLTLLSRLEGTVPASGEVTLAVSGFPDDLFVGAHSEFIAGYTLDLITGDFNGDGVADAADFAVARETGRPAADLAIWATNYAATFATPAATSVPEPTALAILLAGLAGVAWGRAYS